jgi:predicted transcriptional regulator
MSDEMKPIREYVREQRTKANLTQPQLALKAGVGLRFIRDLEQGKQQNFRTDTLNKVLRLFGKCLGPVELPADYDDG